VHICVSTVYVLIFFMVNIRVLPPTPRGLALVAVCCCMLPAWALALWLFPCFTSTRIANGTRIYFYLAFEFARARVYICVSTV